MTGTEGAAAKEDVGSIKNAAMRGRVTRRSRQKGKELPENRSGSTTTPAAPITDEKGPAKNSLTTYQHARRSRVKEKGMNAKSLENSNLNNDAAARAPAASDSKEDAKNHLSTFQHMRRSRNKGEENETNESVVPTEDVDPGAEEEDFGPGAFMMQSTMYLRAEPGQLTSAPATSLRQIDADQDPTAAAAYKDPISDKTKEISAVSEPSDVKVDASPVVIEPDLILTGREENPRKGGTRCDLRYVVPLLISVGVIIGVIVYFSLPGEQSKEVPPTAAPSEAPTQAPTVPACPQTIDWVNILDLCLLNDKIQHVIPPCMLPFYENVTDHLSFSVSFSESCTSATLARMALSFGVMMNPSGIDDPDLFFHLSNLYFSLDGPLAQMPWDSWLSPLIGPCDWSGISCGDDSLFIFLGSSEVGGSIPTEIGLFSSLDRLIVQGALGGTIPSEICDIAGLEHLEIFSPSLAATLPSELANCQNLQILRFKNTNIEGSIPSELGLLQNLFDLGIESPNLSGTIPQEIVSSQAVRALSIHGPVSGTLPSTMADSMESLDLTETSLTGEIPTEIGNLSNLIALRIVRADLASTLPTELGLLMSLEELSITAPGITGTVPTELGALTLLEKIDLFGTKVEGTLPTELGLCTDLREVDVEFTRLSGMIPAELCFLVNDADRVLKHNDCGSQNFCLANEC